MTRVQLLEPPQVFLEPRNAPSLSSVKTNGDLIEHIIDLHGVIDAHNSDKKAVREWLQEARKGS